MKKKILLLPFLLLSNTSCLNEKRCRLPITNEESVVSFLENTLNLKQNVPFHEIDYETEYIYIYDEKTYIFQYKEFNVVMESLDEYKCYKPITDLTVDIFFELEPGKDTVYTVIEKIGLPTIEDCSGFSCYTYFFDNYCFSVAFIINENEDIILHHVMGHKE